MEVLGFVMIVFFGSIVWRVINGSYLDGF